MIQVVKTIMSPNEVRDLYPLTHDLQIIKNERDKTIRDILSGKDNRLLFIVGPCSADNEDAVVDYTTRLAKLSQEVKDKIFIVPRIYTNKPRTRGEGYKGMLHNPNPHKRETDIQEGILAVRRMHLRVIKETGLTSADEMLYPDNAEYCDDLLSYTTIGARSSENQQHRLVASGINGPVGIKNPMHGSFSVLLNSIYAAQIPNEFKFMDKQIKTSGNEFAHAILRGSVDNYGLNRPNYHYEDLVRLNEMYYQQNLAHRAVIIDTNHSNSGKNPFEQPRIAKDVVYSMRHNQDIKKLVKGFLIESYIEDGNQSPDECVYGKSITDACLGIEKTKKLIRDIAERI